MVGHWPFSEQRAYLTNHPAYSSSHSGLSLSLSLSLFLFFPHHLCPGTLIARQRAYWCVSVAQYMLFDDCRDPHASTFCLCVMCVCWCWCQFLAGTVGSASAGPEVWAVCVMWKERRRRPNKEELALLSERQLLYTKQVQLAVTHTYMHVHTTHAMQGFFFLLGSFKLGWMMIPCMSSIDLHNVMHAWTCEV